MMASVVRSRCLYRLANAAVAMICLGSVSLMQPASRRCTRVFEGRSLAGEHLPLRKRGGASFPEGLLIDEAALEAEVVVDVGVNGGELL